jgi:hypothetical protein
MSLTKYFRKGNIFLGNRHVLKNNIFPKGKTSSQNKKADARSKKADARNKKADARSKKEDYFVNLFQDRNLHLYNFTPQ